MTESAGASDTMSSRAGSSSSSASQRLPGLAIAGVASVGAGAIHAAAAGIHAEYVGLTRLFVAIAAAQLAVGVVALVRPRRLVGVGVVGVNLVAVLGWLATRISDFDAISGLETRESPQFADSACAALGAVAAAAALGALLVGWRHAPRPRLALAGIAAGAMVVPAMFSATSHSHSGGDHTAAAHDHGSAEGAATTGDGSGEHDHSTDTSGAEHDHGTDSVPVEEGAAPWPRPWDPAEPIDVSGVVGVTAEQEARATALIEASLAELPKYADPADAIADGYVSIGDARTGSEHFIRYDLVIDDVLLDARAPESLVYTVNGDQRTLAGAMYIASARPTDDPTLLDWAGPLMQWHNHGDLCWDRVNGVPQVVGTIDDAGKCARGVNTGGANPMVHVWITPHPCGVFAALEGTGAGQAAVPEDQRVDMCQEGHDHGGEPAPTAKPYDPTKPIDLSGTPGVTEEQQAAAENLVAVTLVDLPQWADYRDAEAAGFRSIGDGLTGHEHFIQWDWINDDVVLDPDFPESLVYEPQPDGSRKLVSAMYMLPADVALSDVPDIGGALMQWHIHDNLCFTTGDAPRVAGVTSSSGGCPPGLQKFQPAPMIHVWITPHPCGPFAALEGVGAGQIEAGEERLCDHAHGSGGF